MVRPSVLWTHKIYKQNTDTVDQMDGRTDGHSWFLEQACLQPAIKNTVLWIHTRSNTHSWLIELCGLSVATKMKIKLKNPKIHTLIFCYFTIWYGFGLLEIWSSVEKKKTQIRIPDLGDYAWTVRCQSFWSYCGALCSLIPPKLLLKSKPFMNYQSQYCLLSSDFDKNCD